jgi:hypothetical protein
VPADSGTSRKPVISSERSESRNLAVVVAVVPLAQRDPSASLGVTAKRPLPETFGTPRRFPVPRVRHTMPAAGLPSPRPMPPAEHAVIRRSFASSQHPPGRCRATSGNRKNPQPERVDTARYEARRLAFKASCPWVRLSTPGYSTFLRLRRLASSATWSARRPAVRAISAATIVPVCWSFAVT